MPNCEEALLTGRSDEGLESWVATPRDANAKRGGFRFKAQAKSLEQVQMMKKVEQQMSARKPATPPPQPATVPSEGTDPWAKAKAARAAVFDAEAELAVAVAAPRPHCTVAQQNLSNACVMWTNAR